MTGRESGHGYEPGLRKSAAGLQCRGRDRWVDHAMFRVDLHGNGRKCDVHHLAHGPADDRPAVRICAGGGQRAGVAAAALASSCCRDRLLGFISRTAAQASLRIGRRGIDLHNVIDPIQCALVRGSGHLRERLAWRLGRAFARLLAWLAAPRLAVSLHQSAIAGRIRRGLRLPVEHGA
jgi:hypothetical protein